MRLIAAVLGALLLATGCGTSSDQSGPAVTPPSTSSVEASPPRDRQIEELQTTLAELIERMDVMNARMQRIEAGVGSPEAAAAPQPEPAPPRPAAAKAARKPEAAAAAPAEPLSPMKGAELAERYRTGLTLFGKNNMPEARKVFEEVFRSDPGGELADNALYWIGETYFSTANYTDAIRFFQRVSTEYANENKAPDALLKIGMIYVKTGDLLLARKTFQQLIDRYPYATPAANARTELKRIKY